MHFHNMKAQFFISSLKRQVNLTFSKFNQMMEVDWVNFLILGGVTKIGA